MFKTLTAFAVSLQLVGTASAEWVNRITKDEFNGSQWKSSLVFGKTTKGVSIDPRTPNYNTPRLYFTNSAKSGFQLHLQNGDQQICNKVQIEVLIDGKRPRRAMVADNVWNNKTTIQIKSPGYWYERFKTGNFLRGYTNNHRSRYSCIFYVNSCYDLFPTIRSNCPKTSKFGSKISNSVLRQEILR